MAIFPTFIAVASLARMAGGSARIRHEVWLEASSRNPMAPFR